MAKNIIVQRWQKRSWEVSEIPDVDYSGAYIIHSVDLEIFKETDDGQPLDNCGAKANVIGIRTVPTKK